MSYNLELHKSDLNLITKKLFKQAVYLAFRDGVTSIAPLGFSGDTVLLFGQSNIVVDGESRSRVSHVSIRNYCNSPSLLITDKTGSFIAYYQMDSNLGIDFIVDHYWLTFKKVKSKIQTKLPKISKFRDIKEAKGCTYTEGFEMLKAYQNLKLQGLTI